MKRRCTNPNSHGYENYGGRGISICSEWFSSFEAFLKDMGEKPLGTLLDREDNNGDYSKSNCHWVTRTVSNRNRRSVKLSPEKAEELRELYSTGKFTRIEVGKKFNLGKSMVDKVLSREIWA
jgi:hypothetical protein